MRTRHRDPHDAPARRARADAPPGPVPSIGDFLRERMGGWCWIICINPACSYQAPAALAPLAIRFGMGASSDVIRRRAVCPACHHRGAMLRAPSWAVNRPDGPGWALFPTFYRSGLWSERPIEPDARPWRWSGAPKVPRPIAPAHFTF